MTKQIQNEKLAAEITSDPRWQSIVDRDKESDGKFFYSVKTTGVYCRPSCGARLARPENVHFYTTTEAAERAGFRACKRCKPAGLSLTEANTAKIEKVCRLIERSAETPLLEKLAKYAGMSVRYPEKHADFLQRCHVAGQLRPTPLLLQYGTGDYNCLHQDLYGEHVFPIQVAILLSEPQRHFTGGEFVLAEQRPRMQSRPEVVPLQQGDAVAFAVHHRPVQGARGIYRVNLRHGVSRLRSGQRHTVGIIFHDAN